MADNIHLTASLPMSRRLVDNASPSLRELADEPKFEIVDQTALFADVQDDMAALLASVMRRQASRRTDKVDEQGSDGREEVVDRDQQIEAERVRDMLLGGGSWQAAYDLARGLFPAPAELALLLASLRDDAELDDAIREEAEQALASLVSEHGAEQLSAGANIRHVVASFAARTGLTPESLRQAYRTLLGGESGEAVTYRYLLEVFGLSRRGLALDFLEQALAADMAAEAPSKSADDQQQSLLALLFQFRLLRSADALLISAARQYHARDRRSARNAENIDLVDGVLVELLLAALTDLQDARRKFETFLRRWRSVALERHVADWARGMLRAMAEVPLELFPDLPYREALLTSLSGVIDALFYRDPASESLRGRQYV